MNGIQRPSNKEDYGGTLAGQSGIVSHQYHDGTQHFMNVLHRSDDKVMEEDSLITFMDTTHSRPRPVPKAPKAVRIVNGRPSPRRMKMYPYWDKSVPHDWRLPEPDNQAIFKPDSKPLKKNRHESAVNVLYRNLESIQRLRYVDEDGNEHPHQLSVKNLLIDPKPKTTNKTRHVIMSMFHSKASINPLDSVSVYKGDPSVTTSMTYHPEEHLGIFPDKLTEGNAASAKFDPLLEHPESDESNELMPMLATDKTEQKYQEEQEERGEEGEKNEDTAVVDTISWMVEQVLSRIESNETAQRNDENKITKTNNNTEDAEGNQSLRTLHQDESISLQNLQAGTALEGLDSTSLYTINSIRAPPMVDAKKAFMVIAGTITSDNRLIEYNIEEFFGTCFNIKLKVLNTGQEWVIFVPSSNTITYLLRVWVCIPRPENNVRLGDWMLRCTTLNFEDNYITSANFDVDKFRRKCARETSKVIVVAAIRIQAVWRGKMAKKRFYEVIQLRMRVEKGVKVAYIRNAVRNIAEARDAIEDGTAVRIQTNLKGATIAPTRTVLTINPHHATNGYAAHVGTEIVRLQEKSPELQLFRDTASPSILDAMSSVIDSTAIATGHQLDASSMIQPTSANSSRSASPINTLNRTFDVEANMTATGDSRPFMESSIAEDDNSPISPIHKRDIETKSSRKSNKSPIKKFGSGSSKKSPRSRDSVVVRENNPTSPMSASALGKAGSMIEMQHQHTHRHVQQIQEHVHSLKTEVGMAFDNVQDEMDVMKKEVLLAKAAAKAAMSDMSDPLHVGPLSTFYKLQNHGSPSSQHGSVNSNINHATGDSIMENEIRKNVMDMSDKVQQLETLIEKHQKEKKQMEDQITELQLKAVTVNTGSDIYKQRLEQVAKMDADLKLQDSVAKSYAKMAVEKEKANLKRETDTKKEGGGRRNSLFESMSNLFGGKNAKEKTNESKALTEENLTSQANVKGTLGAIDKRFLSDSESDSGTAISSSVGQERPTRRFSLLEIGKSASMKISNIFGGGGKKKEEEDDSSERSKSEKITSKTMQEIIDDSSSCSSSAKEEPIATPAPSTNVQSNLMKDSEEVREGEDTAAAIMARELTRRMSEMHGIDIKQLSDIPSPGSIGNSSDSGDEKGSNDGRSMSPIFDNH